jgi:hypothetical protein
MLPDDVYRVRCVLVLVAKIQYHHVLVNDDITHPASTRRVRGYNQTNQT